MIRIRLFVVPALVLVACQGEDASSTPVSDDAALSGVFRPKDDSAAIREMQFRDTHYRLAPHGCADAACEEQGTFTLDRAKGRLDLVASDGHAYAMPFAVKTTSDVKSIRARDLSGDPSQLIVETGVVLIQEATIDGQDYSLFNEDSDQCDNSGAWPRIWEGELCGGTAKTHGFAHCYVKTSECSSSPRSCLDDDTNGKRWDGRADECSKLGGRLMESSGSGAYIAQACCKR